MDPISYAHSAKQAQRIKKIINDPDSVSGIVTVPKTIAAGENVTIPAGRVAVLPNVTVSGTVNVQGEIFVPSGTTYSPAEMNPNVVKVGSGTAALPSVTFSSDLNTGIYNPTANSIGISTAGTERLRVDANGNIGFGVIPSAWATNAKLINIGLGSTFLGRTDLSETEIWTNVYRDTSYTYRYKNNEAASGYTQDSGKHIWYTAPSGIAGSAISWTNAMSLDASGNLLVGVGSGSVNTISKNVAIGSNVLNIVGNNYGTYICAADSIGFNNTLTAMFVSKISTTSRSINAAGTINTSGADYAEYEYSNDITIDKGQIVGFKADGTLTDKYSESIRFAIKSTNPSIVGGDTWGIEEIVGKRPKQPVKTEEMTDEEFTALEEQYKLDLADFEARLEVERQKVDRIAYAGKVPVNVLGATAGDYIVVVDKDDNIDGEAISNPTFEQYLKCVGRVNKILEDGRAEVAVIIH